MNIFTKLKRQINLLEKILHEVILLQGNITIIQEALGRIESRQLEYLSQTRLNNNEFRVFSQWGEDGIIQLLLRYIEIPNKVFIEFGVENYTESNTRFLLTNNNWIGLVIDGSQENINYIKNDSIYWRYNLKAVCAFINKDNINTIITDNGIAGEIGILSIDIDGNDYWVWKAINAVNPAIVIIEYNSKFGLDKAITIPYDPYFIRSEAHYSMLYAGASLRALCNLGKAKGYAFVGCNSAGNNAFFVRQDLKPNCIKELTVEEGYVASQFRESRDEKGNLSYLSDNEVQKILFSLPLVDVE